MHDAHHAEPTGFLSRVVFSRDHKVIAKQFLLLGLLFLGLGGILALLIRWQLAFPGKPVPIVGQYLFSATAGAISPEGYTMLFTMHGTIMIFFAITPMLIGAFGNLCIPLMIGARDMAFPLLNMLSFWVAAASGVVLAGSFFVEGGAAMAGWTAYPPLSGATATPGLGQTLWAVSLFLGGVSTLMGAINYVTTILMLRAPGMGFFRMPLSVWGLGLAAVLNILFVPVIAAALLMLILDRVANTGFFVSGAQPGSAGDPLLFQHLFWIFGHPEVYILILPAWGIVSDLLAVFSRKPAFGFKATAIAMSSIVVLSTVVYGHHMYTVGLSPGLGKAFMSLTMLISIPSSVLFLNWLGTIWRGSIRLEPAMLFALGVVFVFGMGGLTGLFLGAITTDIYLHDTAFVVGHFHYTMAASVLFGSLAAIYFWFPKMFGRMLCPELARLHFWFTFLPLNLVFFPMLIEGYGGMPRRLYEPTSYKYLVQFQPVNQLITFAAMVLGLAQLIFVWNVVRSLWAGERAPANPWEATTLEWLTPSPPPHENFDVIPEVHRGPHEHSRPDVPDRDWIGQWESQAPAAPQTPPAPPADSEAVAV
ncbi:MAG: cbb3-type cytochrome c oxidase subunit I [Candidatus Wallbacteria bacterium]|nr:cbb3-type cytochrome c oxidase subunit I [Candidatus Wallbacteria bacterium]